MYCVPLGAQAAKAAAASTRRASVAGPVSGAGSDTARGGPLPSARGRRESTVGGGVAASVGSRRGALVESPCRARFLVRQLLIVCDLSQLFASLITMEIMCVLRIMCC